MRRLLLVLSLVVISSVPVLSQQDILADSLLTDTVVVPATNNSQLSTVNYQLIKIGFLSYDSAFVSMPEYAIAQQQLTEIRQAYDKEMQRVEKEFNDKYEEFLDNRRDYPRTILLKRQTELQNLLQQNIEFKNQSLKELKQIEEQVLAPLRIRLNETIATVAREKQLAMVVNTDSNACPFIEPMMSVDLNGEVRLRLAK